MSGSVSFRELVNLAIGSPELGAVNFNALHSLLHGLLDHLQLGDKRKTLSLEEREFIQPVRPVSEDLATKDARPTSLFHQLQDKMTKMEARLEHLDSLPTSDSLLQRSQQEKQPVQEMWQLIQLRRKVEMNEDGVHKAMGAFQELLSTFNGLKETTTQLQDNLGALKGFVAQMNINDIERRLQELEGQSRNIPVMADKLAAVSNRLMSYPESSEVLTWGSLHGSLTDHRAEFGMSEEQKQREAKHILSSLGQLPGRHEGLELKVQTLEVELRRLEDEISNKGVPEDLLEQLRSLREDVDTISIANKKGADDLWDMQNSLRQLNLGLQQLQSRTDSLAADLAETATLQGQISELDRKKLDREELTIELSTKADKRALEAKVSQSQLEAAVNQVSSVLEDLIKKLSVQEAEWQGMMEKLLAGLEAKLSRSDLDSIHKNMEELWRTLKKHLSAGDQYDPDGAAGSRKRLFEKVKCISCDRPVTMATGPHLVTVRAANLVPRNQLNGAEMSRERNSGDPAEVAEPEFQYSLPPRPHTAFSHHPKTSRAKSLATVLTYGDPGQALYKNCEVDVMGVDGIMYRGRLDRTLPSYPPERDPSGVRSPQPPGRMERSRSATPLHRHSGHSHDSPHGSKRPQSHTSFTPRSAFHVPTVPPSDTPNPLQLSDS
ncbi:uncharacterized protein C16orf96 homolog isoform X2 [Xenopus laevis]|uniref:Uncharacterized protein C16orf96 homolog isoform X2 n=1 Tax=Xenopus laevis TaxID=8355 RepID=A0A8J0U3J1_XENLA|nr:uncharacterized protein C16orf96 homolog isoform X2 [Xenopus laevis]